MSLVMHIFKKDLRRLRVFLFFWLPVVLVAGIASSMRAPADDFAMQTTLKVAAALAAVCQFIMMASIVPLLMHSEPPTGTTAFWLTRPVNKGDVLKSKLLFVGLFFVLVPIAINAVLLAANHIPFSYILPATLENLISYMGALLLLMAISSMTRNFGFFALTGVVYLVLGIILSVIIYISDQFQMLENTAPGMGIDDSRNLLSSLVGIAMLSGIVFIQFRFRKTRWSYYMLILNFLLTFWLGSFCDWNWFKEPAGILSEEETKRIEISIGKKNSHISDSFSMRRKKESHKEVSGDIRFDLLPPHAFAKTSRIEATFEADGLKVGEATQANSYFSRRLDKVALRSLLEPIQLVHDGSYVTYSDKLLKLKESDYIALKGKNGTYTADISLNIFRYKQVAVLPLAEGGQYKDGPAQISIASVLNETMGCTVIVHELGINPLFKRDRRPRAGDRFTFLLANPDAGEAYMPEDDNGVSFGGGKATGLISENKFLRFSSIDKPGTIDEAWLKSAQLLIVETEWLGTAEKQIVDDRFSIGSASKSFSSIPGTGSKDNASKLAEVALPGNPSRAEIKTYIQKIHNISATQSNFSPRDPQVAMLLEVGSENIDLLVVSFADQPSHYETYAIKKLAKPKDKDLILKHLEQQPQLAETVVKFGWENDARNILLSGLKNSEYLPGVWLKAVAGFNDPETYPLLTGFLVNGSNRDSTYGIIKDLPGIELEAAVAKAWRRAKYEQDWARRDMIPIAIAHGHTDALAAATQELGNDDLPGYQRKKIRKSIATHTGIRGTDEELKDWYLANKGRLHFEEETKLFVAEGTSVAQSPKPGDQMMNELRELLQDEIEIADTSLSEKGEIILTVIENSDFVDGALIVIPNPQESDLEEVGKNICTTIRVNRNREGVKRLKQMKILPENKVSVVYEEQSPSGIQSPVIPEE